MAAGPAERDDVVSVGFPHFQPGEPGLLYRNVPARKLTLASGETVYVTSVFDLQVAQYGIDRGLGGKNVAKSYDDATVAYTPAWAARITDTVGPPPHACPGSVSSSDISPSGSNRITWCITLRSSLAEVGAL